MITGHRAGNVFNSNEEENKLLLGPNGSFNGGHQLTGRQLHMIVQREGRYNDQRAQEAEQIEAQLHEVNRMMSELAILVKDQEDTIINIGKNIDKSNDHMEGAIEQLQIYLSSLNGNRWLMIKVFAIMIFMAVIFTAFVA